MLLVAEVIILQPLDDELINKSPCTGDNQGKGRKSLDDDTELLHLGLTVSEGD